MPVLVDSTGRKILIQIVDGSNNGALITRGPGYDADGNQILGGEANAGSVAYFSEVDNGSRVGDHYLLSPETDTDYRLRVAHDTPFDQEIFSLTTQNTGKHTFTFTTMAATMTAAGLTTNSGNITTTATGLTFGSFAQCPVGGTQTYVNETSGAFTAQPTAQSVIDFGGFQRGATTAFAPLDGIYFRHSAAGLQGVINSGGVETLTAIFPIDNLNPSTPWAYVNNAVHRYLIQANNVLTTFWIDNILAAAIATPAALAFPCKSQSLPWSIRHAIVGGAAGSALSFIVSDYRVYIRGPQYADDLAHVGNRSLGSYQGLSGQTMGSLAGGVANNTQPTAFLPTNTSLVANGIAGLGGSCIETDTLAVSTDGIIMSYQLPAPSSTVPGRRLCLTGVRIDSFVQTALTGGGYNDIWFLCFGHTAVSLAQAETGSMVTATTKAPRRIALGSRTLASAAAALTQMTTIQMSFSSPIYVNAGEFIAMARRKVGTAPSVGAIQHVITLDYGWE